MAGAEGKAERKGGDRKKKLSDFLSLIGCTESLGLRFSTRHVPQSKYPSQNGFFFLKKTSKFSKRKKKTSNESLVSFTSG